MVLKIAQKKLEKHATQELLESQRTTPCRGNLIPLVLSCGAVYRAQWCPTLGLLAVVWVWIMWGGCQEGPVIPPEEVRLEPYELMFDPN